MLIKNAYLIDPASKTSQKADLRIEGGFISRIAEKDYSGALSVIQRSSLLPSICGRVCPQENQCQKFCTVGKMKKDVDQAVGIGRLERFVADHEAESASVPEVAPETGKRVAVVGSGPASIACAADVRRSWRRWASGSSAMCL